MSKVGPSCMVLWPYTVGRMVRKIHDILGGVVTT